MHAPIFTTSTGADGTPRIATLNEHAVAAFIVQDGEVIGLERAQPRTVIQLDVQEARHRSRLSDQRIAELTRRHEVATFRKAQPRRVVSLGDLEGRALPSVAAAAQRILDLAGTIAANDGRLVIERPERFSPGGQDNEKLEAEFLDCVRVLVAAGDIVVKAVESTSKKPTP
jgi:hypothetical protein